MDIVSLPVRDGFARLPSIACAWLASRQDCVIHDFSAVLRLDPGKAISLDQRPRKRRLRALLGRKRPIGFRTCDFDWSSYERDGGQRPRAQGSHSCHRVSCLPWLSKPRRMGCRIGTGVVEDTALPKSGIPPTVSGWTFTEKEATRTWRSAGPFGPKARAFDKPRSALPGSVKTEDVPPANKAMIQYHWSNMRTLS